MHLIERLEPSQRVKGRVLVWFSGEKDPVRVTENEVVSCALWAGKTLEEDDYRRLKELGGASSARAEAARMLSRRPLSRRELERKLESKGIPDVQAQEAAEAMEQLGAVNDLEYARSLVRHYSAQGWGEQKLRAELSRRGVPRDLWEEALAQRPDPVGLVVKYLRACRRDLSDPKERKRACDALLRRGFSWEEIRTGLLRVGEDVEEESI